MTQEIKMLNLLLDGQKDIKEQIAIVQEKVDKINERSLINEQSIIHLEKSHEDEKEETGKKFDIVHGSIRRRDGHLKWLVASILLPVALSIMAFLNISPK